MTTFEQKKYRVLEQLLNLDDADEPIVISAAALAALDTALASALEALDTALEALDAIDISLLDASDAARNALARARAKNIRPWGSQPQDWMSTAEREAALGEPEDITPYLAAW